MIEVKLITKKFGSLFAIKDFSIDINHGEFFALLGPSGCGKTTLLRVISGFETPDSGDIFLDKENITNFKPFIRPTNLMFQSYALFPHFNVFKNIAYGLEREKLKKSEIFFRVNEIINKTNLNGLEQRYPDQLSGGQKQRVALARCLVKKPKVLLLDEPLTALDKNLKEKMKVELKNLQKQFGITFIMVTHDQDEALALADRVAVMNEGNLIQVGSPKEIYSNPENLFVAEFIGKMNFFQKSKIEEGNFYFQDNSFISLPKNNTQNPQCIGIRPEDILFKAKDDSDYVFEGKVVDIIYHGQENEVIINSAISQDPILIRCHKDQVLNLNTNITLYCAQQSFRLY
jgi:ABC-type Fe3+/spermidine/putrescine transport system ATPase subunit